MEKSGQADDRACSPLYSSLRETPTEQFQHLLRRVEAMMDAFGYPSHSGRQHEEAAHHSSLGARNTECIDLTQDLDNDSTDTTITSLSHQDDIENVSVSDLHSVEQCCMMVVESIESISIVLSINGTIVSVSNKIFTLLGHRSEDMIGTELVNYLTDDEKVEVSRKIILKLPLVHLVGSSIDFCCYFKTGQQQMDGSPTYEYVKFVLTLQDSYDESFVFFGNVDPSGRYHHSSQTRQLWEQQYYLVGSICLLSARALIRHASVKHPEVIVINDSDEETLDCTRLVERHLHGSPDGRIVPTQASNEQNLSAQTSTEQTSSEQTSSEPALSEQASSEPVSNVQVSAAPASGMQASGTPASNEQNDSSPDVEILAVVPPKRPCFRRRRLLPRCCRRRHIPDAVQKKWEETSSETSASSSEDRVAGPRHESALSLANHNRLREPAAGSFTPPPGFLWKDICKAVSPNKEDTMQNTENRLGNTAKEISICVPQAAVTEERLVAVQDSEGQVDTVAPEDLVDIEYQKEDGVAQKHPRRPMHPLRPQAIIEPIVRNDLPSCGVAENITLHHSEQPLLGERFARLSNPGVRTKVLDLRVNTTFYPTPSSFRELAEETSELMTLSQRIELLRNSQHPQNLMMQQIHGQDGQQQEQLIQHRERPSFLAAEIRERQPTGNPRDGASGNSQNETLNLRDSTIDEFPSQSYRSPPQSHHSSELRPMSSSHTPNSSESPTSDHHGNLTQLWQNSSNYIAEQHRFSKVNSWLHNNNRPTENEEPTPFYHLQRHPNFMSAGQNNLDDMEGEEDSSSQQ